MERRSASARPMSGSLAISPSIPVVTLLLGLDRTPQTDKELNDYGATSILDLLEKDGNDPSKWEHLMMVPMRFNRLVIYRPWMWHAPAEPFGNSIENGRLMQLMSFATQGPT